jgi:hypothetical protein
MAIRYEDEEKVLKLVNVTGENRKVLKTYIAQTLFALSAQVEDALLLQQLYAEVGNTDLGLMPFRYNAIFVVVRNLNTKYKIN